MSDLKPPAKRRQRADAERNVAGILDAAARVLSTRPDAGMEDIAKAAGVSRQTVYAHFPSREALINELVDKITKDVAAALEAAELDKVSATDALVKFLEIGWEAIESAPFLLQLTTPVSAEEDRAQHQPILGQLDRAIRRGRRTGEFDRRLPVTWFVSVTLALGHAAGEEVRAGRMTMKQARALLRTSVTRLFAPEG